MGISAEKIVPSKKRKRRGRLVVWDHLIVRRLQKWILPNRLHQALIFFVRMGDGWGWGIITCALLWTKTWPEFKMLLGQSLLSVAISLPVYWALKLGTRRVRPFRVSGKGVPRVPPLDRYSFPSGHVMNNLAVAMTLALHIPYLWPLAVFIPLSLGLLRVFYGVHFLSDILAGAVLGGLSAFSADWLFPRISF